jgi:hypothetical protein
MVRIALAVPRDVEANSRLKLREHTAWEQAFVDAFECCRLALLQAREGRRQQQQNGEEQQVLSSHGSARADADVLVQLIRALCGEREMALVRSELLGFRKGLVPLGDFLRVVSQHLAHVRLQRLWRGLELVTGVVDLYRRAQSHRLQRLRGRGRAGDGEVPYPPLPRPPGGPPMEWHVTPSQAHFHHVQCVHACGSRCQGCSVCASVARRSAGAASLPSATGLVDQQGFEAAVQSLLLSSGEASLVDQQGFEAAVLLSTGQAWPDFRDTMLEAWYQHDLTGARDSGSSGEGEGEGEGDVGDGGGDRVEVVGLLQMMEAAAAAEVHILDHIDPPAKAGVGVGAGGGGAGEEVHPLQAEDPHSWQEDPFATRCEVCRGPVRVWCADCEACRACHDEGTCCPCVDLTEVTFDQPGSLGMHYRLYGS